MYVKKKIKSKCKDMKQFQANLWTYNISWEKGAIMVIPSVSKKVDTVE